MNWLYSKESGRASQGISNGKTVEHEILGDDVKRIEKWHIANRRLTFRIELTEGEKTPWVRATRPTHGVHEYSS